MWRLCDPHCVWILLPPHPTDVLPPRGPPSGGGLVLCPPEPPKWRLYAAIWRICGGHNLTIGLRANCKTSPPPLYPPPRAALTLLSAALRADTGGGSWWRRPVLAAAHRRHTEAKAASGVFASCAKRRLCGFVADATWRLLPHNRLLRRRR